MSRIGRTPIPVPSGVQVTTNGLEITVKGPKGQLSRELPADIAVNQGDGTLLVTRPTDSRRHRALHGLTRTLVANMVQGVTNGFQKNLEIQGVGYRAQKQGEKLVLQVGYSHPVEVNPPEGISFVLETPTRVGVAGINKELVGEIAAQVRRIRKPEPYKGKGIRYQGEVVRRKAGKAGKAGGGKKK